MNNFEPHFFHTNVHRFAFLMHYEVAPGYSLTNRTVHRIYTGTFCTSPEARKIEHFTLPIQWGRGILRGYTHNEYPSALC